MQATIQALNSEQYQVLNKIAEKTKMDCWFSIRQNNKLKDYIYDLENKKKNSIKHRDQAIT